MIYERFVQLCKEKGETPTSTLLDLKLCERSSVTRWKSQAEKNNGICNPQSNKLIPLAKHFNVSTDYLLGLTDEKNSKTASNLSGKDNAFISKITNDPYKMIILDEIEGLNKKSLEQVIRLIRTVKQMQE